MNSSSPPTLHVGLDGRAFSSPAGGVRRYASALAAALAAVSGVRVTVLGGSPGVGPAGAPQVAERIHPPGNPGWTWVGLPRTAAAAGVDVLHALAYTAPLYAPVPVVVSVHDVSYARHPEWYPHRRDAIRRAYYRLGTRRAAAIIAPSHFSASEIRAAYGVVADRVAVVPLGVEATFADAVDPSIPLPPGVPGTFLLHVGDLHARRNPGVVIAALEAVAARGGPALTLVLAGVDRGEVGGLAEAAAEGRVVALGAVDEPTLRLLYRRAFALVYPSRYEGFGFPVIEAMAAGLPVVASHAASIPEVAGDAALLVDPFDVGAWADALTRLALEPGLRETLVTRGQARAATFTWERTARLTADVYRRVAGR